MPRIPVEAKKQALIADLVSARSQVLQAASALHSDYLDAPFLGVWSAHDILAHLIGWDETNLGALTAIRSGCLPEFFSAYDADWHTFNALPVRRHKQATVDETVACVAGSHHALVDALANLPADDLIGDFGVRSPRGRRVTIAMLLQAEAGDERKHAGQITAYSERIAGG